MIFCIFQWTWPPLRKSKKNSNAKWLLFFSLVSGRLPLKVNDPSAGSREAKLIGEDPVELPFVSEDILLLTALFIPSLERSIIPIFCAWLEYMVSKKRNSWRILVFINNLFYLKYTSCFFRCPVSLRIYFIKNPLF